METLTFNTPMCVSAVIMIVTFIGIFTEGLHGFHRTKFALLGAMVMLVVGQFYGFYSAEAAVESVDWNVVFLLGAMMTVVSIMIPTGGFETLAYKIADLSKGRLFVLMILMGSAVAGISLMLDNVTTVVIFGPIIVLICDALEVNPVPYLLCAALLSDTGGVATLVGDPPNLMIGSARGIDFNTFFEHMGAVVFIAYVASILALRLVFHKDLKIIPKKVKFESGKFLKDRATWNAALFVLAVMVVLFVIHNRIHWEAWMVAVSGLTLLLFIAHKTDMDEAFGRIEITLLTFFIALFVIIGGVEHTHFLEYLGQQIEPLVKSDLKTATIALMWIAAVMSAMIDNIPFTAAMIPIIAGMEAQGINVMPLWWALAIGVGMGGNGTHLGSTANVFIVTLSERVAKKRNDPSLAITPGLWFRKGTPVMIATLISSTFFMWFFFEFFSKPV